MQEEKQHKQESSWRGALRACIRLISNCCGSTPVISSSTSFSHHPHARQQHSYKLLWGRGVHSPTGVSCPPVS